MVNAAENALENDLARPVAVNDVLGLADIEFRKAVDGDIREQLERVGALETPLISLPRKQTAPLPE